MTLVKYALKNMKKDLLVYVLTIFQLAAVITITIVMVSSVLLRFRYYTPFQDIFEANGIYAYFYSPASDGTSEESDLPKYLADDEILPCLSGAKNVISCNRGPAYCIDEQGAAMPSEMINLYYDDDIISRFIPEMESGRWLNLSRNADCIEAVISQNDYGWKVGDKIKMGFFAEDVKDAYAEVLIVGEIKENAKLPGYKAGEHMEKSFEIFYGTASYSVEQRPFIIMSSDYLADNTTVLQGLFGSVLITYPNDYSAEMLQEEKQKLTKYNCVYFDDLKQINAESRRYLYEQVYNLLPISIVLLILVVVSSISCSALSVRRELKSYTIFYMTGLEWKHCSYISLIQAFMLAGLSLALSGIVVLLLIRTGGQFKFIFEYQTISCVLGILVFFILIFMLMPMLLLSRTTPKQLLTK